MTSQEAVRETLRRVEIGAPQGFRSLTMFPLIAPINATRDYVTLDEALGVGDAVVTEVSQAGHVPELLFENRGAKRVLLLDGDELVGARQNRVLNLTILVGARRKVVIPVSCVEQGRWAWTSRAFRTENRMLFAGARAEKAAQVNRSMRERGARCSDQGEVWRCVAQKVAASGAPSATGAMRDAYLRFEEDLRAYEAAFSPVPRQVGAVFAVGARPAGLELFDTPETLRLNLAKLVGSYALDAVESRPGAASSAAALRDAAAAFVARAGVAEASVHPGVDEGEDVRVEGQGVVGAALVTGERVVHLSILDRQAERGAGAAPVGGSLRRRRHFG